MRQWAAIARPALSPPGAAIAPHIFSELSRRRRHSEFAASTTKSGTVARIRPGGGPKQPTLAVSAVPGLIRFPGPARRRIIGGAGGSGRIGPHQILSRDGREQSFEL